MFHVSWPVFCPRTPWHRRIECRFMAAILTRCPRTGQTIPTGLSTDVVIFATLPNVPIPVPCHACSGEHYWTYSNAWVADEDCSKTFT